MTFLQPIALWGLPLVLLPLLIHLFNRLRHRPHRWAAMGFLQSEMRRSSRQARLRQILILLVRSLAVLALILTISRPWAGAWTGWFPAATPEVVILILDRSASMETLLNESETLRSRAVAHFDLARRHYPNTRFILLENVRQELREIPRNVALGDLPDTVATTTGADLPRLLQMALDWVSKTQPGAAEVWIASDLQASSWPARDFPNERLSSFIRALPSPLRVRLMAFEADAPPNAALTFLEVREPRAAGAREAELTFEITRNRSEPATLPLTWTIAGQTNVALVNVEGTITRIRHPLSWNPSASNDWGTLALPADGNAADNRIYFLLHDTMPRHTAIVASDYQVGQILALAAAPNPADPRYTSTLLSPVEADVADWANYALVLWQAPFPEEFHAAALLTYMELGGIVLFFPSHQVGAPFLGAAWNAPETTAEPWPLSALAHRSNPLSDPDTGALLNLQSVLVEQRQSITGARLHAWASYNDGTPFLARRSAGVGEAWFCTTLPKAGWSRLSEGQVLLPLVQRLLDRAQGGSSRGHRWNGEERSWPMTNTHWTCLSGPTDDPASQAGVYVSNDRRFAVNRPPVEDDLTRLTPSDIRALLPAVRWEVWREVAESGGPIEREWWRWVLAFMAACLLMEALLILPPRAEPGSTASSERAKA